MKKLDNKAKVYREEGSDNVLPKPKFVKTERKPVFLIVLVKPSLACS